MSDQPRDTNGRFSSDSVSLRDHVDALLDSAKEIQDGKWCGHDREHSAHDREHALIATALGHQEIEAAEWRKAANEWRGTVGDLTAGLATKYVTRETFDTVFRNLQSEAKKDRQVLTTQIIAASGVAVGAAVLISRLLGVGQ